MYRDISLNDWWPWYSKIVGIFGYDRARDQRAADVLSILLAHKSVDPAELKALISGRPVLVFGAGPSLEENLHQACDEGLLGHCLTISADGATTALLKIARVTPNVVVTDLDGRVPDLLLADRQGAIMVIHGHGDNIDKLEKHVPKFTRGLGTTQVEPRPGVYNFGGFTDGDRAVFLAAAVGANLIALMGMDLGHAIGEYSKTHVQSVEVKRLKLKICKELLEWLASKVDIDFFNLTGHGENIRGFRDITPADLRKMI